jgi:hypothetical protein
MHVPRRGFTFIEPGDCAPVAKQSRCFARLGLRVAIHAASLWSLSAVAVADTLLVPSQYTTIQAAIDAAVDGDEVIVADGTYTGDGNRDIDFLGKAITVRSENGADNCIIDCEGTSQEGHRGCSFQSGEPPTTILDGFTITNGVLKTKDGVDDFGGGIYIVGSSPTIRNCIISDCHVNGHTDSASGGGIYISGGSPTIEECAIIDCGASHVLQGTGGGIAIFGASAVVSQCSVISSGAGGGAGGLGGGILCSGGASLFDGCLIIDNSAHRAGGIYASGDAIVRDCMIVNNSVVLSGAGFVLVGNARMERCVVAGNHCNVDLHFTVGGGGGLCREFTSVTNCVIVNNSAVDVGGGLLLEGGAASIANCTIVQNVAMNSGGAVMCMNTYNASASAVIVNSIIRSNVASNGGSIAVLSEDNKFQATLSIHHCNVEGGFKDVEIGTGGSLEWGAGNIDANPLFVDADGPDDDPLTYEDNDYRLESGSPCIDAGDNLAVPADSKLDLAGEPRFQDDPCTFDTGNPDGINPIVDMGAYEFQTTSCDADGNGVVNAADLAQVLATWGACNPDNPCTTDFNGDGVVDEADLAQLLANWN